VDGLLPAVDLVHARAACGRGGRRWPSADRFVAGVPVVDRFMAQVAALKVAVADRPAGARLLIRDLAPCSAWPCSSWWWPTWPRPIGSWPSWPSADRFVVGVPSNEALIPFMPEYLEAVDRRLKDR